MTNRNWLIDQQYLSCKTEDIGIWCKKSLPLAKSKTEFLTAHVCADISCTVSDCFFDTPFKSDIYYQQPTTLLVFGLQGYSTFSLSGSHNQHVIREGDVWLINVDNQEIQRSTQAGLHSRMAVIKYSTQRINNAFNDADDICTLISGNKMIRLGHQETPYRWISELVENPMLSAADRLIAEARALELIARWLAPTQVKSLDQNNELQPVIDQLTEDLASTPSLEVLAAKAGMSHARLNRLFKICHGVTVFDWLRNYRLQRAHYYLKDSQRSITEIAFQCGFSSASHFAQAYKKQYGHSPSQNRR